MDFQKYINQSNSTFSMKLSKTTHSRSAKPKIIKFIGNMEQNVKQIYDSLDCKCSNKKQFYNIMMVFANKIEKLRKERDHYKSTLKQYFNQLYSNNYKIQNPQNQFKLNQKNKCYTEFKQKADNQTKQNKIQACRFSQQKQANKRLFSQQKDNYSQKFEQLDKFDKDLEISLNLSVIQFDYEQKDRKEQHTLFEDQKHSILSESNLLESDEEQVNDKIILQNNSVLKQKQLKYNHQVQNFSKTNKLAKEQNQRKTCSFIFKPKQNQQPREYKQIKNWRQQQFHRQIKKKNSQNNKNKQNRIQKYIKKYTMTLQKLEQFIQRKECIKQVSKNDQYFNKTQKKITNGIEFQFKKNKRY